MTIILTNPDVVMYCGDSIEFIQREIRDYNIVRRVGLLPGRKLRFEAPIFCADTNDSKGLEAICKESVT